jgi:putative transposase
VVGVPQDKNSVSLPQQPTGRNRVFYLPMQIQSGCFFSSLAGVCTGQKLGFWTFLDINEELSFHTTDENSVSERIPMRKVNFRAGYYYHLYNRGVNRQPIFFNDENWAYFIKRLRHYCKSDLIDIVAYCLMPNHYHLLVHLKIDDLSRKIMQPFTVSYTKAVNKQQSRVGPIFQGPFKAKLIDKDEYLLHLSRYIHLNPVQLGLVDHPAAWKFSSYQDYVVLRKGTLPRPDIVLSQFPSCQAYAEFVNSYSKADQQLIEHLMLD